MIRDRQITFPSYLAQNYSGEWGERELFDKIWKMPSVFLNISGWIYQASCNLHFLLKTIIEHPAWAWSLWVFVRSCVRTLPFKEAMFTVRGESEMFKCFLSGKNGSRYLHRVSFCSVKWKWKWKSLSHVRLFVIPWIVHGILQARILESVAFSFSRGSSQPRDWTQFSCTVGWFFNSWATRETQKADFCSVNLELNVHVWSELPLPGVCDSEMFILTLTSSAWLLYISILHLIDAKHYIRGVCVCMPSCVRLFVTPRNTPRDRTQVSCIADRFFTVWATGEKRKFR